MYIGDLIDDIIRPKTGNTSYARNSTTGLTEEGISNDLVLSFINDALSFIVSRIISVYPSEFTAEQIIPMVIDQEEYEFTDNVFLNNKIISIEYSSDASLERYYPLPPGSLHQRRTTRGTPYMYIRRNGKILLNPIPNNSDGAIRINYYRALDKLNIRRGQITSKTLTTIVLDNDDYLDSFALASAQYICIVDALGNVQDYNIRVVSYDSTTRTITMASQTIIGIAAQFIVTGRYQSTHIPQDKPDRLYDYCKVFAQARIYNTDSSVDEINERIEVSTVLNDIVDQFSEMTEDIQDIPIIDEDLA